MESFVVKRETVIEAAEQLKLEDVGQAKSWCLDL
jgi:hypothetical protein